MHSLLIHTPVADHLKQNIPGIRRYYRLLYNGFSLLTLLPLALFTRMVAGDVVFQWQGTAQIIRIAMILLACYLFRAGAKAYDFKLFVGIRQYQTEADHVLLSKSDEFTESGVFGLVRHPWYLGSLLIIWSLPASYPKPLFLTACILSLYLVVGTLLEERKLLAYHGEKYRQYTQRVSMFFPWKRFLNIIFNDKH